MIAIYHHINMQYIFYFIIHGAVVTMRTPHGSRYARWNFVSPSHTRRDTNKVNDNDDDVS